MSPAGSPLIAAGSAGIDAGAAAPDYVRLHAAARPDHVACLDLSSGRSWTYAELDRALDRYTAALSRPAGDRIVVLARNSGEQLVTYLGCARARLVFVPLNWRLAEAELRQLVEDSEPSLVLHDEAYAATAVRIAGGVECLGLDALATRAAAADPRRGAARFEDLTTLLYTSGTSGRPKGVRVTERNAFFTGLNFMTLGEVTGASVMLCDSPMFHVIGLVASIRAVVMCGGTLLMSSGFDPAVTLGRLSDPALRVSHYFCVPQMAERLFSSPRFEPRDLRGLTALFTGGAPNPAANVRRWLDRGLKLVDGFGMTEAGTVLGMPLDAGQLRGKAGASGLPAPTVEVRIVDAEGQDVADGVPGELLIRGPNVTAGYWRREQETRAAFADGGWLRSGDLGSRDADGYISIVGRRKEMFISGGENVYPVEVEACLIEHPAVREVAVVGVPDPDWGEVGQAFVVLNESQAPDAEALRTYLAGRLARYKVPRHWQFVAVLPRTATGKLQKHLLPVSRI